MLLYITVDIVMQHTRGNLFNRVSCTPAAPLDAGFDGCGDMNLPKCEGSVLPLIYCLLTKFTASELGM